MAAFLAHSSECYQAHLIAIQPPPPQYQPDEAPGSADSSIEILEVEVPEVEVVDLSSDSEQGDAEPEAVELEEAEPEDDPVPEPGEDYDEVSGPPSALPLCFTRPSPAA